jgi:hypothetical protein
MAMCFGAFAALVLVHLQATLLFEVTHGNKELKSLGLCNRGGV